jgi:hypothetical protein
VAGTGASTGDGSGSGAGSAGRLQTSALDRLVIIIGVEALGGGSGKGSALGIGANVIMVPLVEQVARGARKNKRS